MTRDGAALGDYRLLGAAPSAGGARIPAVIFMHGFRGSPDAVARNRPDFAERARRMGVRLVLPRGLGTSWSFPNAPSARRDEFAFFEALRQDLIADHGVDPDRIVVAGFSIGAAMAWSLGCWAGDRYLGVVAVAGALWRPAPDRCPRPARRIRHIHGLGDPVVPLEGRVIRARFHQGDVEDAIAALFGGRGREVDMGRPGPDGWSCQRHRASAGAPRVDLCLHDGGHVWRPAWIEREARALLEADAEAAR
ncbi:MAG: PHB depolymerase family esterase [Pseudomonadota bacterium]